MNWLPADPRSDNRATLIESWHRNAARWIEVVRSEKIASRASTTNAAILSTIKRHRPARVLDLGCGEGWLCRALAEDEIFCVGIDVSQCLIESAKANDRKGQYQALSYAQLIESPKSVGNYFDMVVANFSLLDDHQEELFAALSEISVDGARLVVQTLHPLNSGSGYKTGWQLEKFEGFGNGKWSPMPWYFRTLADWSLLLSSHWKLERIEEPCLPGQSIPTSLILTARR